VNTTIKIASMLLLASLASSCGKHGLGVSSESECSERYAMGAGSKEGVNLGIGMCRQLFDPATSSAEIERAKCVLPKLPRTTTHQGVRLAVHACDTKG
jgi:hypothetical protein